MKVQNLVSSLARVIAVPLGWLIAISASHAAIPAGEEETTPPPRSEIQLDRMQVLHSLLGEKVVPLEQLRGQGALPRVEPPPVIAQDQTRTPPPPPP